MPVTLDVAELQRRINERCQRASTQGVDDSVARNRPICHAHQRRASPVERAVVRAEPPVAKKNVASIHRDCITTLSADLIKLIIAYACAHQEQDRGWMLFLRATCKPFQRACKEIIHERKWTSKQVLNDMIGTMKSSFHSHWASLRTLIIYANELYSHHPSLQNGGSQAVDSGDVRKGVNQQLLWLDDITSHWSLYMSMKFKDQQDVHSNHFIQKCELLFDMKAYVVRHSFPLESYEQFAMPFVPILQESKPVTSAGAKILIMIQCFCDAAIRMNVPVTYIHSSIRCFMERCGPATTRLHDGVDSILRIAGLAPVYTHSD